MAARVSQSAVSLFMATNPNARIHQSVVTLFLLAAPVATPGVQAPESGAGGVRPSTCGCSPEELIAEQLRRLLWRRGAWPYRHVFGAGESTPVEARNTVAVPAIGNTAVVVGFQVPSGLRFMLEALIQVYSGAFAVGDGTWTVDVNSPLGVANVQAMPVQGLTELPVPLGSVDLGAPWGLPRAYEFAPLDLVQSKFTNAALIGGFLTSMLLGYLVPDVAE